MKRSVFIGWHPPEQSAFHVARRSLVRHLSQRVDLNWLMLSDVRSRGLYTRPMEIRQTGPHTTTLWDVISDAPQSTEHANSRFLVKELAREGWALFCDHDVLFRADINGLFDELDPSKALYCVWHNHVPDSDRKMDGKIQQAYTRKNWSSVMCLNVEHPANERLTLDLINSAAGRDLHRFVWLDDSDIGQLDSSWNHLVGVDPPRDDAKLAHYTLGLPSLPGYERCEYSDEWRLAAMRRAA